MRIASILCTLAMASAPGIALGVVAMPSVAMAQSNPFTPPSNGGLSRRQVEEMIARQAAQNASNNNGSDQAPSSPAGPSGSPAVPPGAANGVTGIPSQGAGPGAPSGNPVQGMAGGQVSGGQMVPSSAMSEDPVEQLLAEGGSFIGCVGSTPVFADKVGRRAYFTTKELRNSHEARRFARC